MAAAWFGRGRPDVGRVTVSGLLCRGTVSGVVDLLRCCSGVPPSVGIGVAPTRRGWWHMVHASPPLLLLLALPAAGAFQRMVNEGLCACPFPGGRNKSRRANHPSLRLLGHRRTFVLDKEERRVRVTSSCMGVLCELLSTSEGEACGRSTGGQLNVKADRSILWRSSAFSPPWQTLDWVGSGHMKSRSTL